MATKTLIDLLVENGTLTGVKTGGPDPAQPAREVQCLPGGLDYWTKSLDQPADPEPSEVDLLRAARLQQAAQDALANLTARERFETARTRARRAGLYQ